VRQQRLRVAGQQAGRRGALAQPAVILGRGRNQPGAGPLNTRHQDGHTMNNIVYIVGAVVIVIAILGFLGLR
jgi:hypothetical protein